MAGEGIEIVEIGLRKIEFYPGGGGGWVVGRFYVIVPLHIGNAIDLLYGSVDGDGFCYVAGDGIGAVGAEQRFADFVAEDGKFCRREVSSDKIRFPITV